MRMRGGSAQLFRCAKPEQRRRQLKENIKMLFYGICQVLYASRDVIVTSSVFWASDSFWHLCITVKKMLVKCQRLTYCRNTCFPQLTPH